MRKSLLAIALGLGLGASACSHQPIAMMASSEPLAPGSYEKIGPVYATDCRYLLFGVLPVSSGNSLQGALKDAVGQKEGADALVQVTADYFRQFWIILGRECTQVEGIAVRVVK